MASESAPVSAAPVFATLSDTGSHSTTGVEPPRTKSLKRGRQEISQNQANLASIANAGLSPSLKSARLKGTFTPAPLTGAAAIADERRRREESERSSSSAMSENPGHKVLSSLMAGVSGMSKPQDAPPMSEGMSIAANAITIPSPMQNEHKSGINTSPASVTSLFSLATTAQTATASPTVVASPAAITGLSDGEGKEELRSTHLSAPSDDHGSRAFSYPGNRNLMQQPDSVRAPARGLSLPMPGQTQQLAPRSPSQKKHKCPYCETEFTRHHNLKSHLLTHSQEKPYICQSCQMRFRRLHDLKRHTKLHTGERPHICPKCDRKFARGDALARHSKGQGGCAGRRTSMGSFGGDDDFEGSNAGDDDAGMEGVMYSNGAPGNEPNMTEEDRRRLSLPSIKAQHVPANHGSQNSYTPHSRAPSTYPPAGPRQVQPSGGLYPPNIGRGGTSSSGTSPSMQSSGPGHTPSGSLSMALSTSGGSMYAQSGMTESPKPLSPAGMHTHQLGYDPSINRARSPSLATQMQQQNFGRHQPDRASPTGMSLPSPHGPPAQGLRLPSLPVPAPSLAPPDQKYTLSSQAPSQQIPMNGGPQGQSASNSPNTVFPPPRSFPPGPHHQQSSSADSSNNLFAGGESGVWTYVKTLENRVEQMTNELNAMQGREKYANDKLRNAEEQIKRLTDEAAFLRSQLGSQSQP